LLELTHCVLRIWAVKIQSFTVQQQTWSLAMSDKIYRPSTHTSAWIAQTWISFVISVSATTFGILYLPVDGWIKSYLGMGMLFSVGSTVSLAKTVRDVEESKRMLSRIDEAKLERLLAEYDPFKQ
jgi:hypothetical protein